MYKSLAKTVRDKVSSDRITCHKDGTFTAKKFFFYTHGYDEDKFAERVTESLEKIGLKIYVLETAERWNNWPKDSWWEVKFKVINQN